MVITLCGSTRFKQEFEQIARELTLAGHIVLMPGIFAHADGIELTEENKKQFLIPRGFAHGFLVLSDTAEFCYKCDDFYHPNDEGGLLWSDPDIGVEWPIPEGMELTISEKDQKWGGIKELKK